MAIADRTHVLLIVDGDDSTRRRIGRLLIQQPLFACEIVEARNGTAGLAALSARTPDCVLLACTLPDMSAPDFIARAGDDMPCPMVLLTSPGEETQARLALKRGVREHLDKHKASEVSVWRAIAAVLARRDRQAPRRAAPKPPPDLADRKLRSLLSHDLRAPLQCILGYAELLRVHGPLSPQQDKHVGAMMQAGHQMITILDRLVDKPVDQAGTPQESPEPPPAAAAEPHLPGAQARRLLVVDDIAVNRDVIGAFLHAAGHEVSLAESGEEAIRLAFEQSFDLILMDVRMPEMDGLEATRRIRALPAPRGDVPILGVTAHAFLDQVADCRAAGMDGHVAKPVGFATLMDAIAKAIARVPTSWQPEAPASPPLAQQDPPPGLDRAILEETLSFLRPDEIGTHLQTLRARKEELVRLLDMPVDPALLTETAHALASVAGMFGFTFLSVLARRFEHAMANDSPEAEQLGHRLRTETRAALATLDALRREHQMQAA